MLPEIVQKSDHLKDLGLDDWYEIGPCSLWTRGLLKRTLMHDIRLE
jgi:hypothetical protein